MGWEGAGCANGYPQGERARACWMSFSVSKVPVFPGSLTTVASINRSVGRDADSVTRPRSSNSAQQSLYSQSLLLRSRLSKATSESSASLDWARQGHGQQQPSSSMPRCNQERKVGNELSQPGRPVVAKRPQRVSRSVFARNAHWRT